MQALRKPAALAFAALVLLSPLVSAQGSAPGSAPGIANPELFSQSLQAAAETITQYHRLEDPAIQARVQRIGYELAQQAEFTKYPFTFDVVEMPVPNAFALPAGQIFITRGLLDLGLDDDMVAAVLGHEIGHVTQEHYLKMQRRATLMNVLGNLLVVGVAINEANTDRSRPNTAYDPRYGYDYGTDRIQGAAAASLVISELLLRSYSRDHEDEADKEGQRLAALAGYDPDGARRVWEAMNNRAPQLREYGYWQTHPFGAERMRAADARKGTWKQADKKTSADEYRKRTQATLQTYLDKNRATIEKNEREAQRPDDPNGGQRPREGREPGDRRDFRFERRESVTAFLKAAMLAAWPQDKLAEDLRLERLHRRRDAELAKPQLSRDYGTLLKAYRDDLEEARKLDPKAPVLAALQGEIEDLDAKRKEMYAKAVEVLGGGIYETSFLESFLSNFPEASQVPEVALALGDAYSRLGNSTEAVTQYLKAWQSSPDSPQGKRAREGLRNLAPDVKALAALQEMALQERDADLKKVAQDRLSKQASVYDDVVNGSEYLKKYPEGPFVGAVLERLNKLADNLYGEVVLYQSMGDSVRAMERINKILTHAPLSPAAGKLRDRALLGEGKEG